MVTKNRPREELGDPERDSGSVWAVALMMTKLFIKPNVLVN
jgi:hypothetical protein